VLSSLGIICFSQCAAPNKKCDGVPVGLRPKKTDRSAVYRPRGTGGLKITAISYKSRPCRMRTHY